MLKLRFQKRCKDSLYLLYAYFFPKKLNPETKIYIKNPKEIQINISLKNGIFSNEKLKIKKKKKTKPKTAANLSIKKKKTYIFLLFKIKFNFNFFEKKLKLKAFNLV